MRQIFLLLLLVLVCLCCPHYIDFCNAFVESSSPEEESDDSEVAVSRSSSSGFFIDETLMYHPWPKSPSPWDE